MQDKMFTAFTDQTRQLFEPMRKLNGLMLDNMEKLTHYQLESMQRYSQLATERMRDAGEIKDTEGLRDFGSRQAEVMNEVSNQMLEDARTMAELSMQFSNEMSRLFAEMGQQAADQASSTASSADAAQTEAAKAATSKADTSKTDTSKAEPAKASSQASRKNS